ncbi:S8 family serine peptidase [Streptomyces marincola]|uniref:S8 family serine peptidase n=1 Tax=Streptomyces marincola TaxID=2878388 RepID=UPI001CF4CF17|nr:S8 family serine peptidase [Streptomyces marincola]UCM89750.1 S8 family serine peptidase [Streptomyces marincola]
MLRTRKERSGAFTGAVAVASATALALGLAGPASGQVQAVRGTAEQIAAGDGRTLTLITGDRVLIDSQGEFAGLIPAEGRESIPVRTATIEGEVHAIPLDAVPLINEGVLDRALFNVDGLSREEYRDIGGLPLIVRYDDAEGAEDLPGTEGAEVTADLDVIDAEALTVSADEAAGIWAALTSGTGVESVSLDGIVEQALDESVSQIGANEVWDTGYDGTGVTIAVLDTGITTQHADVSGKVLQHVNFSASADTADRRGHGTHVASIAAGTGAMSSGQYTGVAPGAQLLSGKVLDDNGSGFKSDVIEAMQWAVDEQADIVNLSLGWPTDNLDDPLDDAVDALSAQSDTLFVIAAGNEGPGTRTLRTPGVSESALTVGAVDKSDVLADFSSRGPQYLNGTIKPDVTAPGVDIGAAASPGSRAETTNPALAPGYVALDGTSMASPHAAGAAALLKQAHPEWGGEEIKAALTASAVPGDYSAFEQGAGRIDVAAALEQTVVADPVSISFGSVEWSPNPTTITRDLVYRNLGDEPVTLDLELATRGPNGAAAPAGTFTLQDDQVTVPAGGTAGVPVVADLAPAGTGHGFYDMTVTATGGGQTVTTPGAFNLDQADFDFDVEVLGADGEPETAWTIFFADVRTGRLHQFSSGSSRDIVLPHGSYTMDLIVRETGENGAPNGRVWLVDPSFVPVEDMTLSFDTTVAEPMSLSVPDPEADLASLSVGYRSVGAAEGDLGAHNYLSVSSPTEKLRTAQIGQLDAGWEFSSYAKAVLHADGKEYHPMDQRTGSFYTGLDREMPLSELARIDVAQGTTLPDRDGMIVVKPPVTSWTTPVQRPLPTTTEVWVQGGTEPWSLEFRQMRGRFEEVTLVADPVAYQAGETYDYTFNAGVFGPVLGADDGLFRQGNTLSARLYPFADGSGHRGTTGYRELFATLYRDGQVHGRSYTRLDEVDFDVPAGEADYRLVWEFDRDDSDGDIPPSAVSTRVVLDATFTSAEVSGDTPVALPFSVVRFTPGLGLDSTLPGGQTTGIPVTVQGSAANGGHQSLTVSYSADGGTTWTQAPLVSGAAQVANPPAGGSVSLRAEVTDAQGNTTTQTIIDAYLTS